MPLAKPLISLAVAGLVATGAYLRAHEGDSGAPGLLAKVEQAVVGTVESGIEFVSTTISTVLPYELPDVLPNGDIIIRVIPPEAAVVPAKEVAPAYDVLRTEPDVLKASAARSLKERMLPGNLRDPAPSLDAAPR